MVCRGAHNLGAKWRVLVHQDSAICRHRKLIEIRGSTTDARPGARRSDSLNCRIRSDDSIMGSEQAEICEPPEEV